VASTSPVQLWYHTLDLPGQDPTPGWFDLRTVSSRLPWPQVRGARCLDIATYDGFYAFEMERRGAASVVATDIGDHSDWDWPLSLRQRGGEALAEIAGEKGTGFETARELLGSSVEKVECNVYDLSPERVGSFDMVICGSLLLHLRDPVRALEAIRSVCDGWFMSIETVSLPLSLLFPHRPMAELGPEDRRLQWWTANAAGHRRLVEVAGFTVTATHGPFAIPFGTGHPESLPHQRSLRSQVSRGARRAALHGHDGVAHAAVLARPT
jgi:tRNA (mo5U34)-methyltransferase